jgi:hypothetical protein
MVMPAENTTKALAETGNYGNCCPDEHSSTPKIPFPSPDARQRDSNVSVWDINVIERHTTVLLPEL